MCSAALACTTMMGPAAGAGSIIETSAAANARFASVAQGLSLSRFLELTSSLLGLEKDVELQQYRFGLL